jgi:hypothetical protein
MPNREEIRKATDIEIIEVESLIHEFLALYLKKYQNLLLELEKAQQGEGVDAQTKEYKDQFLDQLFKVLKQFSLDPIWDRINKHDRQINDVLLEILLERVYLLQSKLTALMNYIIEHS